VTQYFTQLNSYFVILEVPPQLAGDLDTLRKLYVRSSNRSGRCRCRFWCAPIPGRSHRSRSTIKASSRRLTISFNLAPGAAWATR